MGAIKPAQPRQNGRKNDDNEDYELRLMEQQTIVLKLYRTDLISICKPPVGSLF